MERSPEMYAAGCPGNYDSQYPVEVCLRSDLGGRTWHIGMRLPARPATWSVLGVVPKGNSIQTLGFSIEYRGLQRDEHHPEVHVLQQDFGTMMLVIIESPTQQGFWVVPVL